MIMKKMLSQILCALALTVVVASAHADSRPVTVVELYTSQGCSSCPPADAYLGKIADREDVIALSFHVDYWDYIGWKDKFARPEHTQRQRKYAGHLGMGYIYTPQLVVQGMAHSAHGSEASDLVRDLRGAKRVDVAIKHVDGGLQIEIPDGPFENETARVLVAAYDAQHDTVINRGENSGKTLSYYNVVRDMARVGRWSGAAKSFTVTEKELKMAGRDGCAVLIQSTKTGRILGAAKIDLTHVKS